jgi:hypothetical protein
LSELLPLATEAVRIAFRVGSTVGAARDALTNTTNTEESWSTIVSGIPEKEAKGILAAFHDEHRIPASAQAYISAISTMALTISGPPATTKRLFESVDIFKNKKYQRLSIPIYAPYHASHLYSQTDIGSNSIHSHWFILQTVGNA